MYTSLPSYLYFSQLFRGTYSAGADDVGWTIFFCLCKPVIFLSFSACLHTHTHTHAHTHMFYPFLPNCTALQREGQTALISRFHDRQLLESAKVCMVRMSVIAIITADWFAANNSGTVHTSPLVWLEQLLPLLRPLRSCYIACIAGLWTCVSNALKSEY